MEQHSSNAHSADALKAHCPKSNLKDVVLLTAAFLLQKDVRWRQGGAQELLQPAVLQPCTALLLQGDPERFLCPDRLRSKDPEAAEQLSHAPAGLRKPGLLSVRRHQHRVHHEPHQREGADAVAQRPLRQLHRQGALPGAAEQDPAGGAGAAEGQRHDPGGRSVRGRDAGAEASGGPADQREGPCGGSPGQLGGRRGQDEREVGGVALYLFCTENCTGLNLIVTDIGHCSSEELLGILLNSL